MRADLEVVARSSSKSARFVRGLRATLRRPEGRGRGQEMFSMFEISKMSREAPTTNFWTGRWRNAIAVTRQHVGEGRGAVEDWSPSDAVWRPTKWGSPLSHGCQWSQEYLTYPADTSRFQRSFQYICERMTEESNLVIIYIYSLIVELFLNIGYTNI